MILDAQHKLLLFEMSGYMKKRFLIISIITIMAVILLPGCQSAGQSLKNAGNTVIEQAESAGNALNQAVEGTSAPNTSYASSIPTHNITLEEAQKIALDHAGLTADQVSRLHTEYEIEHGIPQYDVEFHQGTWEYDYEIHADTGEVLSFSKDD